MEKDRITQLTASALRVLHLDEPHGSAGAVALWEISGAGATAFRNPKSDRHRSRLEDHRGYDGVPSDGWGATVGEAGGEP